MSNQPARKVRRVSKLVASNPVARAVAWAAMVREARDWKIAIWDEVEGAPVPELINKLATFYTTVLVAARHDNVPVNDEYLAAVAVALDALRAMSMDMFRWRLSATELVDDGLDGAALLVRKLTPAAIKAGVDALESLAV